MPEHVTVATVRVRDDRFTCVTLYDVPRDRLDEIVAAFEEGGPWTDDAVLAALREAIEHEVERGEGLSEGELHELLAQDRSIGPALWLLKNHGHGHIAWPLDRGWIVGACEDEERAVIQPIGEAFLAHLRRQGATLH